MKGLFKLIIFVAVLGGAYYFGRPHVEEFLAEREASKKGSEEPAAPEGEPARKDPAAAAKGATKEAPKPAPGKEAPAPVKPPASEIERAVMELYPDPEIPELDDLVSGWSFVPERAFPRKLTLTEAVDFELVRDGKVIGKRGVPAGSAITGKAFSEGMVKISPEGSDLMEAVVPIDSTDLKESIQKGYDAFVVSTKKRVEAQREAERKRIASMKATAAERDRLLAGWTDGKDPVFDTMKASLGAGELKDRQLVDAVRWRWLGSEMVNGVTYDAGLVETHVETIFGVFPSEWKALIRNGKVERWVETQ